MKERDCANCKHHTSDGCSSWDCEYEPKDLISRTDAIEAVCCACDDDEQVHYPKCTQKNYCLDVKALLALPSADAVQGWIPCSERLPSDANEVLACTDGVWVDIAKYNIGREEWYVIGKGEKNITAWMPLPTPYKGGDAE